LQCSDLAISYVSPGANAVVESPGRPPPKFHDDRGILVEQAEVIERLRVEVVVHHLRELSA
jgi:hypothetical protein